MKFRMYAGVVWWMVRDRWYMSRLNPWGAGSVSGRHRASRDVVQQLEQQGPALLRAAMGKDGTPPSAPPPPLR